MSVEREIDLEREKVETTREGERERERDVCAELWTQRRNLPGVVVTSHKRRLHEPISSRMGRVVEGGDNRKDPGHSHKI